MKCGREGCDNEAVATGARVYKGKGDIEVGHFTRETDCPRCNEHIEDVFDIEFVRKDRSLMEIHGMSQEEKKVLYGPVALALEIYYEQDPPGHQSIIEDIIIILARRFATHPIERADVISALCHNIFDGDI